MEGKTIIFDYVSWIMNKKRQITKNAKFNMRRIYNKKNKIFNIKLILILST